MQGVPYPALQKRDKPRRVDLYFSSWVINAGRCTAKTLILFNDTIWYEGMEIFENKLFM